MRNLCATVMASFFVCGAISLPALAEPESSPASGGEGTSLQQGEVLALDETKLYKIYDAYDENGNELDAHSDNSRLMFNSGGSRVAWIKYGNTFEKNAWAAYLWRVASVSKQEKTFELVNQQAPANAIVADVVGNALNNGGSQDFVTARKGNLSQGSPLKFIVMARENGKTYVKIEQVAYHDDSGVDIPAGRFMSTEDVALTAASNPTSTAVRSYVTWVDSVSDTDRRHGWWVIEEVGAMPGSAPGSELMFATSAQRWHYRIPALTTNNQGDVILFSDYRYDSASDIGTNWGGWNGVDTSGYGRIGHRIDQVVRISKDNGQSFGPEKNLTQEYTYKGEAGVKLANGYGDPALVSDRESNKVLMVSVGGSYGFHQEYPGLVSMLSRDGGKTFEAPRAMGGRTTGIDATAEVPENLGIYALPNGGSNIYSMFMTSGRMHQSRYIKVGSHYRIYGVVLAKVRETNRYQNFVLYSDDFGDSWHFIPGSAINGGDEAKVDELPNGDLIVTSRINAGRKVNIFSYNKDDKTRATGTWGTQSSFTIPGAQAQVNGDLLVVYAKNKETGEYGYLALQTFVQGRDRRDARVYYRWIDENSLTPQGFAQGFSAEQSFVLSKHASAYSVMTLLANGKIGLSWEEGTINYNISYTSLPLETITGDKFELAFDSGIGSSAKPFLLKTPEQIEAHKTIYKNEALHFERPQKNMTDFWEGIANLGNNNQDTAKPQTDSATTDNKQDGSGTAQDGQSGTAGGDIWGNTISGTSSDKNRDVQSDTTQTLPSSSEDLSEEGKVIVNEVRNDAHIKLQTAQNEDVSTTSSIPRTGDMVAPTLALLLLIGSGLGIAALHVRKKSA